MTSIDMPGKFADRAGWPVQSADFNPLNCPVRDVIHQLSGKWVTLMVLELADRPRRFGELRRALPDISQRMLTQTLRDLQRDGFVARKVYPSQPPSVEYSLTAMGRSFLAPLCGLIEWAKAHHPAIREARETFDLSGP